MGDNLVRRFYEHALARPDTVALNVNGRDYAYGEVARAARGVAAKLLAAGRTGRVGVLGQRSAGTYLGVIGACWAGASYVPLGLNWPDARLAGVLGLLELGALIVDEAGERRLNGEITAAGPDLVLRVGEADEFGDAPDFAPISRAPEHGAYIIFTSGTTGTPKGVEVGLSAILGHLAVIQEIYQFAPADRVSLAFELTFDPSILNMFMTWNAGAALYVVPLAQTIAPIGFIREHQLSVWNSAPMVVGLLHGRGELQPGVLASLRISIFGGEALSLEAARAWARAAPNSVVDGVYGPTEATIECLHQRLSEPPVATAERGSLALGSPYPGTQIAILDEALNFLPENEPGELAIAGPQLATAYIGQPELSDARFPTLNGVRWYLTGDLAYRDQAGIYHHLGRLDDQVKIRGQRVELGDVESHLRQVCGTPNVAAIAWPYANGSATGLAAFIAGEPSKTVPELRAALQKLLPGYMVPGMIRFVAALPVTAHGKLDRHKLRAMLEEK